MAIHSGSHELFGHLVLRGDPLDVLERWIEAQICTNTFDERDERWWVQEVVLVDGSTLHLFDQARSNQTAVDRVARFVECLAQEADRGEVTLQFIEEEVHITRWTVSNRQLERTERTAFEALPVPGSSRRAREHFERTTQRHTRLWNDRSPSQRFEEVMVRYVPSLPGILVEGGEAPVRKAAFERLVEVLPKPLASWTPQSPVPSDGTLLVEDLEALTYDEQALLVEPLQRGTPRVVAAVSNARVAVIEGRLREDLFYRLSSGLIDLTIVHP